MDHITRSTVNVFAVLEDFSDGSSDILECLAPFFEPILIGLSGKTFNPDEVADAIRVAYKWNFTSDIAEEFVPRFLDRGWIVPDTPGRNYTTYTIVAEERASTDTESEVLKKFEGIAKDFEVFSKSISPLTTIKYDVEHFKEILLEWLLYVDAYSEANLDIVVETHQDEDGKLGQHTSIPNTTTLSEDEKYLCARFVETVIQGGDEVSSVLCRVASIGLLTEVVQDFHRPVSKVDVTDLTVYLDAPIALELLGVSGKLAQDNIQPIVAELQSIGATIRVFGQSLEEMQNNLSAVLAENNPTGPTAKAIRSGDVIRAFVEDVSRDPEFYLNQVSVGTTHRTMDQYPNEFQYFSEDNYEDFFASLTMHHNRLNAREHDATVAALITRMRKGNGSPDIFQSGFVLLTRNGPFAQLARKKCVEQGVLRRSYVSPVVHRRVLATAVWLRTGLGADPDLIPKQMLLASCERVLAIRKKMVQTVKKFADDLDETKAQQLDLLLSRDRSTRMLMDKTLGVSRVITSENINVLFDEMMHPYLEDERQKGAENVKAAHQEAGIQLRREKEKSAKKVIEVENLKGDLEIQHSDDKEILDSLCREVEGQLASTRKRMRIVGLILACLFVVPPFAQLSLFWRIGSALAAVLLGYLTLTGSALLRIGQTEEYAINKLKILAAERSLDRKLNIMQVEWKEKKFALRRLDSDDDRDVKLL